MYIGPTFLNKLFVKLRKATYGRLIIENNDYRNTVFLAGTGRSGTTWVADIINYTNTYRYMFEPFHSGEVSILENYKYRQYLRPDNLNEQYYQPAKAILSGDIRSGWIDRYNRKTIVKKRIINDIRAHFLLKWIKTNFPEIKIILLLRHPCAVASSKLQLNWDTHLREILSQKELVDDYLKPFITEIENASTIFEKHIFMWCVENYIPLKQLKKNEYHLAFYEYYCTRPEKEVDRLFSYLGENYSEDIFKVVKKPSALSRASSAVISGKNLIENWRQQITEKEIETAIQILRLFGLDKIYSKEFLPLIEK